MGLATKLPVPHLDALSTVQQLCLAKHVYPPPLLPSARLKPMYPPPPLSLLSPTQQSINELESSRSSASSRACPEQLFIGGCRALAYSASAATAVTMTEDSTGGGGHGEGGGGSWADEVGDAGDVSRRRYLGKVAMVLRRAARQTRVGENVREMGKFVSWGRIPPLLST